MMVALPPSLDAKWAPGLSAGDTGILIQPPSNFTVRARGLESGQDMRIATRASRAGATICKSPTRRKNVRSVRMFQ